MVSGTACFLEGQSNSLPLTETMNFRNITIINWISLYFSQQFQSCWTQKKILLNINFVGTTPTPTAAKPLPLSSGEHKDYSHLVCDTV
jgi:hypothetical protein